MTSLGCLQIHLLRLEIYSCFEYSVLTLYDRRFVYGRTILDRKECTFFVSHAMARAQHKIILWSSKLTFRWSIR